MNYPNLEPMTDWELILLHQKVAGSEDPTDIDFKQAILLKLKERCVEVSHE